MCKQIYSKKRQLFNLHWGKSDALISDFVDKYNQGKPLGSQLRSEHWELARILVRTYSKQLSYHQAYAKPLEPHEGILPMLDTNNTYLADEMKCSTRKIRRLRTRLKEAGFITGYVFRGQNAQYRIQLTHTALYLQENNRGDNIIDWFIPAFQKLRKAAQAAPPQPENQTQNPASAPTQTDNLSTYSNQLPVAGTLNYILSGSDLQQAVENQRVMKEKTVSPCENSVQKPEKPVENARQEVAQKRNQNLNENSSAGNTHDQAETAPGKQEPESSAPATNDFVVPETAHSTVAQTISHLTLAEQMRLRNLISVIWMHATTALYARRYFDEEEIEQGKACIAEYFCYSDPARWTAGRKEVMRRITLVKLWIKRRERMGKPTYSPPKPGSYFDFRKEHGFIATKAWYKEDKEHRAEIEDEKLLNKATDEYLRSREPGAKESTIDVYKKWQQRLGKRSNRLLNKFHKSIEELSHASKENNGAAA
jgi:DNA-binding Lrp family transcriptional regulator